MKKTLLVLLASNFLLSSCALKGKQYDLQSYVHTLNYREGFKIAQLTDLHFSSYDDLDDDFRFLDLMYRDHPDLDLVILTGDVFTFASKRTVRSVLDYFESKNVPWTITFGNHDEQIYGEYTYASEYMGGLTNAVYTHFDDDINGLSNTVINLKENDEIMFQLYMIDSNTYTSKGFFGYDYVREDQIEFYEKQVELANKTKFGNNWKFGDNAIKSLVFQHIPLPEIKNAVDGKEMNSEFDENNEQYNEKTCPPGFNSGFFDSIKKCESTLAIVTGHDHKNNFIVDYEGVDFIYGVKSTDNMYLKEDMLGYRIFEIENENSYSTRCYFHTYNEVK